MDASTGILCCLTYPWNISLYQYSIHDLQFSTVIVRLRNLLRFAPVSKYIWFKPTLQGYNNKLQSADSIQATICWGG